MHPFGMDYVTADYLSPTPPKRAGSEVMDWQAAEQAATADEELPEGPDDFELSTKAWLRYVRAPFRPFVHAWVAAIAKRARVPLSAASLKKLRGMMRRDVDESAGMLWDAKPEVIAAWVGWYPDWIEGLISERSATDPWFDMPAEQYHRERLAGRARDDGAHKQAQRDRKIGADLYAYIDARGGMVRWRPGLIADELSSQARGKRVKSQRVAEMAACLVRVDCAQWRNTTRGEPWALQLTSPHLSPPALTH